MTFPQDLRYSFRMLLKSPATTTIAVITLALGIGANTAMFSLMRQLFVSNFQYKDLNTLVIIQAKNQEKGGNPIGLSVPDLLDFREQNTVFEGIATFQYTQFILDAGGKALPAPGFYVTPNLFTVLGVPPIAGRIFREDEGRLGNDTVVMLSEGFWTRQFGRDPNMLGKQIRLSSRIYTVVGIMPKGFWREAEAWTPMVLTTEERTTAQRGARNLRVWARLKPGVSVAQADAELRIIAGRLAGQYTETNKGWGIYLLTPKELVAQQFNIAGVLYFLPVGFVLLIACANVAHLQLTRALEREKEMALRTALGAGRFRIVRQLLSESILIGVLGGLAGMTVAYGAIRGLQAYLPPQFTQSIGGLRLDGEALWFMLGLALVSGVTFGFAPAWKASRVDVNHSLKEGSTRSSIGRGGKRFRQVMIVSEIALTTMLLGGAGLTLSMVGGGTHDQMGFNPKNLLTMSAGLQSTRYAKPETRRAFADAVLSQAYALPGVRSATLASGMPLFGGGNRNLSLPGDQGTVAKRQIVTYSAITPDYFRTLEIPLRTGRTFTAADGYGAAPVAIVNEELVRQYFPNKNPIGERILLSEPSGPAASPASAAAGQETPREIVGIVADVKQQPIDILPQPAIAYVPYRQDPQPFIVLALRTETPPEGMTIAMVDRIQRMAPELVIFMIGSMEKRIDDSIRAIRFLPFLLTLFAALGLVLAGVGTYGTTSYSMAQRSQEFGIRMALGARAQDVVRMVMKQGLKLTGVGFALGAMGTYALVKILISLLPPTNSPQPELLSNTKIAVTSTLALLLLGSIGLLANYVPARRATGIDPMAAMRHD